MDFQSEDEYAYACAECDRSFASEHGLSRHNAAKHDGPAVSGSREGGGGGRVGGPRRSGGRGRVPVEGPWACADCERSFTSERGLERHCEAKGHAAGEYNAALEGVAPPPRARRGRAGPAMGTGAFMCAECGKRCISANGLARHHDAKGHAGTEMAEVAIPSGVPGCTVCGKTFMSSHGLSRHCDATGHASEGGAVASFVCSCGKVLTSARGLSRHQEALGHEGGTGPDGAAAPVVVDDGGPYICHACDRECVSARGLARHLQVTGHAEEPEGGAAYVCGSCDRVLGSLHGLNRHHSAVDHAGYRMVEDREFGIQCPSCYRKFGTEDGLAVHIEEKHLPYEDEEGADAGAADVAAE